MASLIAGLKKKKPPAKPTTAAQPALPPPADLEEELRAIWKYPLTKTPVFKDLPRLAQRILVFGTLNQAGVDKRATDPGATKSTATAAAPSVVISTQGSQTSTAKTTSSTTATAPSHVRSTSAGTSSNKSPTSTTGTTGTVTTSIKPTGDVPSRSYSVYLNTSEIEASRASQWPPTYEIHTMNIFHTAEKVFLEFMAENGTEVAVRAEASQLIAVEDSTRYFIIMQAHHEVVPKIIRNTGFAFYTREQAQEFGAFLKEQVQIEPPVVAALEFAKVDIKYKEMKIVPLIHTEPEGYIQEEQVKDIQEFANQQLQEIASPKHDPERLNVLRESITMRLSKQGLGVVVTQEEKRLSVKLQSSGSLTPKTSKNLPIVVAIRRVVNAIADQLETPEQAKVIADELAKPENETYEGDMEMLVESLFHVIGHDSKTSKVFKALTQAIIHTATYQIKTKIKTNIMTGDVRGPDGWQIVVLFAHDVINITHRRREKSLDSEGPKHSFWYEWVLHMVFDKKMGDLASATLRVSDIGYGADIDPNYQEIVCHTFGNGNMIIA